MASRIFSEEESNLTPSNHTMWGDSVKRADLHCHSVASTEADEAVLNAIGCPECFSEPADVYKQARQRGMDFVTITDHDCINGVWRLADAKGTLPPDILVGEEVTCYFPEDRCKMHILVWDISKADHDALQARADNIYDVAAYIEERRIAHAVAHALYRQNDVLERCHLERLLLMFKGFEQINGAHSVIHREALEPVLNNLTEGEVARLSRKHGMAARWPAPWIKSRTAGSDDHGLLNIGRTWTEFPSDVRTVNDLLECLRTGRCRAAGEAGSSLKLAHNFFSVGIRFHAKKIMAPGQKPAMSTSLMQTLVGDRPIPRKRDLIRMAVSEKLRAAGRGMMRPIRAFSRSSRTIRSNHSRSGIKLLNDLLIGSCKSRLPSLGSLLSVGRGGEPPLADHRAIFNLVNGLNRDIVSGIANSVAEGLADGELAPVFNALSAVAAHQFTLLPYYFALFHQNQERHLLPRITGHARPLNTETLRVGIFTDAPRDSTAARFARELAAHATSAGRTLIVHTCGDPSGTENAAEREPGRFKNFEPMVERQLPLHLGGRLVIPPIAEVLEWVDSQQFDVIHIDTPGPIGLCGLLAARMLRVPLVLSHAFDPAGYVQSVTGDYRLTAAVSVYAKWLYGAVTWVLAHGRTGRTAAAEIGTPTDKTTVLPPRADVERFTPVARPAEKPSAAHPCRLLFSGLADRSEIGLLVQIAESLSRRACPATLTLAIDPPDVAAFRTLFEGLPVRIVPAANSESRWTQLLQESDLLLAPSLGDHTAQRVIDAQASGVPVLVAENSSAQEVMDDGVTGLVLPAIGKDDLKSVANAWTNAIVDLIANENDRLRMARTGPQRVTRFARGDAVEIFWSRMVELAQQARAAAAYPTGDCNGDKRPTAGVLQGVAE